MIFNIFLVLLVLSFFGIVGMLKYRMWELKNGKIVLPNTKIPLFSFDEISSIVPTLERHHVEKIYSHIEKYGKNTGKQLIKYAQKLPSPGYLKKAQNLIKGKSNVIQNGNSGSSFIKKIAEHKEMVQNEHKKNN